MAQDTQEIVRAIERLTNAATYVDAHPLAGDFEVADGFYVIMPTGGGALDCITAKGNKRLLTLGAGAFPVKLIKYIHATSVAGIIACYK